MSKEANVEVLLGKIITDIKIVDDYEIFFNCKDGSKYRMFHKQDCCEHVSIEDIDGAINDLIDSEILMAEETSSFDDEDYTSATWTYYRFSTIKGYVTMRWLGFSNGYYSEAVNFEEL